MKDEEKNLIYTEAVTLNICNFILFLTDILVKSLGVLNLFYAKDESKLRKVSATIRDLNNLEHSIKRLSSELKMVDSENGKSKNKFERG